MEQEITVKPFQITPRPYQAEAIKAVAQAAKRGIRRQCLVLSTGTGKTVIFSFITKRCPGRVLILTHRDELVRQAVDKLQLVLGDTEIGIVQAERNDVDKKVIVASIQTLSRHHRLKQLSKDFRLIICDECHHATSESWRHVLEYFGVFGTDNPPLLLGVTATPTRADGIGLDQVFQEIT